MAMIFIYAQSAPAASELAGFARENGYESTALCFSSDQADALASSGADRVLCFSGESQRPESYAGQVAQLLTDRSCALFLVSASARARELAAMVAGRLEWPMANDVLEAALRPEGVIVKRMMYGGAVVQTECYSGPAVLVVPEGKFTPCSGGTAAVETIDGVPDLAVRTTLLTAIDSAGGADPASSEPGGRFGLGLGSIDALPKVQALADALSAELACSRPAAEEKHWLDSARYVGISNLSLKPNLYLMLGISGQMQHMAGVRDAKIIVAVNTDEKALVFRSADYGIVGDLNEFIPAMLRALGKS